MGIIHNRHAHAMLLGAGMVAVVLLSFSRIDNELIAAGGDNAQYLLLGKALAGGSGYVDLATAGHPPHTKYPPLFPAVLAATIAYAGEIHIGAIKVLNAIWALLAMVGVYLLCSNPSREWLQGKPLAIVLLSASSSTLLLYLGRTLSEIMYLCLTVWALVLIRQVHSVPMAVAAGLCVGAAWLTRSMGIALIPAGMLALWWSSREREQSTVYRWSPISTWGKIGAFVGAAFLPVVAWGVSRPSGEASHTYIDEFLRLGARVGNGGFTEAMVRLWDGAGYIIKLLPQIILPFVNASLSSAVLVGFGIVLALVMIWIWGGRIANKLDALDVYVAVLAMMLVIWPFRGERFLLPLLPFFFLYGFEAVEKLCEKRKFVIHEWAATIIVVALCLASYFDAQRTIRIQLGQHAFSPLVVGEHFKVRATYPGMHKYISASYAVREVIKENDVIACRKPRLTALVSEANTVAFPSERLGQEYFYDQLRGAHATLIIVDELGMVGGGGGAGASRPAKWLASDTDSFTLMGEIMGSGTRVYQVNLASE